MLFTSWAYREQKPGAGASLTLAVAVDLGTVGFSRHVLHSERAESNSDAGFLLRGHRYQLRWKFSDLPCERVEGCGLPSRPWEILCMWASARSLSRQLSLDLGHVLSTHQGTRLAYRMFKQQGSWGLSDTESHQAAATSVVRRKPVSRSGLSCLNTYLCRQFPEGAPDALSSVRWL